VEFDQQPHLVVVATKLIDVADELLFDYNDKQSKAAFAEELPSRRQLWESA